MAKSNNSNQNHADPRYPYHSWINEEGQIVYSVPLLAPEDMTAKESVLEASETTYTELTIFGGKPLRVHFVETTDRKLAYDQKSYLNSYHAAEERHDARYTLLKKHDGLEAGDSIWDIISASPSREDGYTLAEYADLPGLIADYINRKHPDNGLYAQVYFLSAAGYEMKEIAEELGIDLQMAYYYNREAYALAREYRKRFVDA